MNHPSYPVFHNGAKIARTWSQFLEFVREAREELGNPATTWYRGQADVNYRLIPSLVRHKDGLSKEQALFFEYQRSAARLLPDRRNDWELLFDMQHYGLPTRLLDWTDVMGVALAFALYDSKDDNKSSAIYILDPLKLNTRSGRVNIVRPTNEQDFPYKSIYWESKPFKPIYPIAIDGPLQTTRLVAQSGAFTVHGALEDFFASDARDCLRAISLEPAAKPEAREFLEYANLNPFSLYPDIVGMARHISRKFF
jgi:FRG domain